MHINKYIKKLFLLLPFVFAGQVLLANTPAGAKPGFEITTNLILSIFSVVLLAIIILLAVTLKSAFKVYKEKMKSSQALKSLFIAGLSLLSIHALQAQANPEDAVKAVVYQEAEITKYILYIILLVEVVVIFYMVKMIKFFTGIEKVETEKAVRKPLVNWGNIWYRMNKFRPIEEEADIDTGHSYDGIRELNNITPPWFVAGFALSILFGIGYMWRYHVSESAPLQIEEYNREVAEAKLKIEEYLKTQANNVDENTVTMLDDAGIAAGKALFTANCVACHGDQAQGAGVGPNLTDEFWLHGGSIHDVFKSIKYGWPEQGMKAWKEDFSPTQIAQLASFIRSQHGKQIPGAKEPQGDKYVEEESAAAVTDSTKAE